MISASSILGAEYPDATECRHGLNAVPKHGSLLKLEFLAQILHFLSELFLLFSTCPLKGTCLRDEAGIGPPVVMSTQGAEQRLI